MNALLDFFSYITSLGVTVMMPLIITVLGLIFRQKLSVSFKAGLTVGIGFVGLNAITGVMLNAIGPVTQALVDLYDFKLTVTDAGWAIGSSIAWGTSVVPFVFVIIIATNIGMIAFKMTKTLNVDIWNYWHAMLPASALYMMTKNMLLAVVAAAVIAIIQLKFADWTQKDVEEVLGLDGIAITHTQANGWAALGYPIDWLIGKIPGIKNINWTPENVQARIGFFSEPMILGLIIGGGLSAVARMPLDQVLQTAVAISASLVLIPRMVALLMDGLSVISEAAQEFMSEKFPGR